VKISIWLLRTVCLFILIRVNEWLLIYGMGFGGEIENDITYFATGLKKNAEIAYRHFEAQINL
jgi:hypothetical protein